MKADLSPVLATPVLGVNPESYHQKLSLFCESGPRNVSLGQYVYFYSLDLELGFFCIRLVHIFVCLFVCIKVCSAKEQYIVTYL